MNRLLNLKCMKKRTFFTLMVMVFAATTLQAQQGPRFRVGLTVSPSLSWLSPETRDYVSEGPRLGVSYGLTGEYHLGPHYAISTNALISRFGGTLKYMSMEQDYGVVEKEREYILSYFEVPVTFKLQSAEIGYFTYFGRIGFAPGFNLSAEGHDSFTHNQTGVVLKRDIKGEVSLVRIAFVFGGGVEYSLGGRTSLVGGLTYNNGFTNALSGRNNITNAFQSATSSFVSLNLGILF